MRYAEAQRLIRLDSGVVISADRLWEEKRLVTTVLAPITWYTSSKGERQVRARAPLAEIKFLLYATVCVSN